MRNRIAYLAAVAALCFSSLPLSGQEAPALKRASSAHSAALRTAPLSPGESLMNLDQLKQRLKQYHDCKHGCYSRDLGLEADHAMAFLRNRAAHRRRGEKLAIVLDIDETTLSNYPEMLKMDFAYNADAFDSWARSAEAQAIPGTLKLFHEARQLGVSVFFLTGRPEKERDATDRNLRAQGFAGWQELILRSPAQAGFSAQQYKSAVRAGIAARGYRIVLNVGDQWSDLRGTPQGEFSVKYPNPFYLIP